MDLDGTLVATDLLAEAICARVRARPLDLLRMPFWLLAGRARFKQRVAAGVSLDVERLPYQQGVIDLIEQTRAEGRPVLLATALDGALARQVAEHLDLFDGVEASDGTTNLKGRTKADRLAAAFGEGGFDYVGNDAADLPVWGRARVGWLAGGAPGKRARLKRRTELRDATPAGPPILRSWLTSLRPHQWSKNVLVFVPLLAAHAWADGAALLAALLAFGAMCLCASGGYLVNDLLDLTADRRHRSKRDRPLATGALSLWAGAGTAAVFVAAGLVLAYGLAPVVAAMVGTYLAASLTYSLWLKTRLMLDVIVLAGLYTIRILVGATATGVAPSFWLLAFSMFIFLSLAMVKRHSELLELRETGSGPSPGRGYVLGDLDTLLGLGCASGFMAVLVLALYINSDQVRMMYARPEFIWLLCPLLMYWLGRVWMITRRGKMHHDPVLFALTDPASLWVVGLSATCLALAV